jgi:hypothetical protein
MHRRYYVYRHKTVLVNGEAVQTIEYMLDCYNNYRLWTSEFKEAQLFSREVPARGNATRQKELDTEGYTYCIGEVNVEVNGFFMDAAIS